MLSAHTSSESFPVALKKDPPTLPHLLPPRDGALRDEGRFAIKELEVKGLAVLPVPCTQTHRPPRADSRRWSAGGV